MASAEYIAAAKQANRQPTTYMSVEDASGQTLYYTSQGQWQGSDTLTNVSTIDEVGSVFNERFNQGATVLNLGFIGGVVYPTNTIYGQLYTATYDNRLNAITHPLMWLNAWEGEWIDVRIKLTDTNPRTSTPTITHYSEVQRVTGTSSVGGYSLYGGEINAVSIDPEILNTETWYITVEYYQKYSSAYTSPHWEYAFSSIGSVTPIPTITNDQFSVLGVKETSQLITSAIDFGADTSSNPIFSVDDVTEAGSTLVYSYSYATGAAPTVFTSGGTIVDGDSLVSGAQYYKVQIDWTTTTGGRAKVREIQLKEGIFRYYGSHIAEPFDGVSPQIIPDSVSSFTQKIKLDKGLSTTGEASVRLFWVPETSDLIASGYLKGKDVAIYSGFVGLDTASYEPVITGTWYDHDLDEVNGIITVKIRDAFKQFEKRKIPEEIVDTVDGSIDTVALTYTTTSLVTVMKDIFDNIGLRDRYISLDFDTLESGDYAAAKYKVSRVISKPQDFSKLLDELAITGSMYLIPLGNGQIKPKPFDINQEHIAILDADEVKFTGLKGNISEFYSRFYAYYNPKTTLTDDPDDDRDDYDNATALIDANAELKWFPERGTKQHFDKWKVGRTSASTALTAPPAALNDLAGLWNSLFTEPLYTVKAVDLGPRYADIEPADVVQVDNLRLPVVDDEWNGGVIYENKSLFVGSEEITANGIAFNNTGTKMFICGATGGNVYQYSLSSAWDVSTGSYDSVSFSLSNEDGQPSNIQFNDDGTKLYMLGLVNSRIFQYTLTTGFDLSTASYDSVSFLLTSQDTTPSGFSLKSDGTKLYMVGTTTGNVYQYTLSTPWLISSATYDSVSFSVSAQDSIPSSIRFSDDGSKFFVIGVLGEIVSQYSVAASWSLSTASYDSVFLPATAEDEQPTAIYFKPDGLQLYVLGDSNDAVFQYELSASFNLDMNDYIEGDRVIRDGKMWRARQDNSGKDPISEATFWQDMEISAEGYTNGKHFFVLGRKFNPNTAQIDLDLMEMPPATLGAFSAAEFSTAFDI